jgi:hypothetical protein
MLRSHQMQGYKFRRQVPIGRYIADFVCHEARLIVEIDGGQHDRSSPPEAERTGFLQNEGYRILRFWNNEVLANRSPGRHAQPLARPGTSVGKPFNLLRHVQDLSRVTHIRATATSVNPCTGARSATSHGTSVAADLPGCRSASGAQNTGILGQLPADRPGPTSLQCRPADSRFEGYRDYHISISTGRLWRLSG